MCRCWDNLESHSWWIIKIPILLSIFVSTCSACMSHLLKHNIRYGSLDICGIYPADIPGCNTQEVLVDTLITSLGL